MRMQSSVPLSKRCPLIGLPGSGIDAFPISSNPTCQTKSVNEKFDRKKHIVQNYTLGNKIMSTRPAGTNPCHGRLLENHGVLEVAYNRTFSPQPLISATLRKGVGLPSRPLACRIRAKQRQSFRCSAISHTSRSRRLIRLTWPRLQ